MTMLILLLAVMLLGAVAADDQLTLMDSQIDSIEHRAGTTEVNCISPVSSPSTISTGSSVIALYHNNKPIAWCNTIATFSIDEPGLQCQSARASCQRCEAQLWLDDVKDNYDYYAPGLSTDPPKDPSKVDAWRKGKAFPMYRFKQFCRESLTLNVRADCPYHDNFNGQDPPPKELVAPCGADAPAAPPGPYARPQPQFARRVPIRMARHEARITHHA